MIKDKFQISVKVGKRFASDATSKTKSIGAKTVNTTVKATKTSTRFVADQASKIPTIGDQS
jgi:stage V sporulation protein SpoVS